MNRFPSIAFTRIALIVVVPIALLCGARAVSWALNLKTFTSGDKLTAADLNLNFQAINDAMVDRTSDQTIAGTKTFTGTVNVGVTHLEGNPNAPAPCVRPSGLPIGVHDCVCPSGTVVLSGGANVNSGTDRIRESRSLSTTTWRVACTDSAGTLKDCNNFSVVCARLGTQ